MTNETGGQPGGFSALGVILTILAPGAFLLADHIGALLAIIWWLWMGRVLHHGMNEPPLHEGSQ